MLKSKFVHKYFMYLIKTLLNFCFPKTCCTKIGLNSLTVPYQNRIIYNRVIWGPSAYLIFFFNFLQKSLLIHISFPVSSHFPVSITMIEERPESVKQTNL